MKEPDIKIVAGPVELPKWDGMCGNCHKRPGTETWVAEGGMIAYAHGFYAMWCKRCCLEAQVKFCRDAIVRLPTLEKQLAELRD
jgi:hypothetical protein